MTGKRRTQLVTSRMWTAVGAMAVLSLSAKSTIQLSRLAMIKSESVGIEETPGSDTKVSKHPDLEVKERYEVGDLSIVSAGIGTLSSGTWCVGFSDLSFRLKANFGLVPVEAWFVCSFSKACSHDLSCLNAGYIINDHVKGIERDWYHFVLSLVIRGEERACVHELFSQESQPGRKLRYVRGCRGG